MCIIMPVCFADRLCTPIPSATDRSTVSLSYKSNMPAVYADRLCLANLGRGLLTILLRQFSNYS